jgi:hypothetical protein
MKRNFVLLFSVLISFLFLGVGFAQPKMNEIYSRGVAGNLDWIEIYNGSTSQLDISGYKIYDIGGQGGTKPKKLFPVGTIVPAKGFHVIITDTADFAGDLSGFGLSSNGEIVWFEDASGTLLDSITFPAMGTTQSYGRLPDGGVWQLLNTITRGFTNVPVGINDDLNLVSDFILNQNFPNPFNPSTTILYQIPNRGDVTLRIFNLLGSEVALLVNETQDAGAYKVEFNARNLSSGIYFYQLKAGSFTETRKLSLLK